MKKYAIYLLLICFISSCNKNKEESTNTHELKVVEAKGYVVPKDSMAEPKVIPVDESKLKKVPAGNPKVVPTNLNVHIAGEPKVVVAGKPRVITPGTDTFSLPKVVVAKDSPFIAKQPKPISALPFRMKDAAICNIQYLDEDEGMNSSYVLSMLEDKSGNLWFGTTGGGVSKYDGKSFTCFTKNEGLSNNYVWSIFEDKRGNLWFGTAGGGVTKYDGKSFTHYTEKEGLSNVVLAILEDNSGNLWFGTNGGTGVIKYNGNCVDDIINGTNLYKHKPQDLKKNKKEIDKSFTHYTINEGLSNNNIWSIIEDKSGNLWFGTSGGGVSKFDGKSFTNYTEKEGLGNNDVRSIFEDKSGNIWFGTYGGGVSKYNGNCVDDIINGTNLYKHKNKDLTKSKKDLIKYFMNYTEKEGLSSNYVRSILEDKSGNLWFGTNKGGVNKYDGNCIDDIINKTNLYQHNQQDLRKNKKDLIKSFTQFTEKEGLSSNHVLPILEDKSGNLWFGTSGGGVCKYNGNSFVHYTEKEGLSYYVIRAIVEDKNGNIWLGTSGGGVCKYDGKSFTNYTKKEGLGSNVVFSILEDKSGNLWFGTSGEGVSRFDGKTFTNFKEIDGLKNSSVRSIYEDKFGKIWFGTSSGIYLFDGKSFLNYSEKDGLSSNFIGPISEDKRGNLWFGTSGCGAIKYDRKSFTFYTKNEGLSENYIFSIFEDKSENLWFGTAGGGVTKYDGKSFTHYTEKEGLSNNNVASIIENKSLPSEVGIWVGTDKGINFFRYQTNEFTHFHKEDGLKVETFYDNSILLDSKNRIWWGSGKALTMLNLNEFKINEKAPKIQLENIFLQENFVDYNNIQMDSSAFSSDLKRIKFSDVARFHNYPIDLELPFDINHLTFHFSAIDWYAPHKIKYQYKLEGLDIDWSNLTSENKADYRNIPFGNYTFKVKAIGSANKWSKTFEYSFIIHPPWWRTWWAYGTYTIIIISSLIFFIRWRERKLKSEKEILEKTVEERTAEVVEQKNLIQEKHKEITDSINYAERIQRSFLATKELLNENLKDYFVFFQPKDVVSGDFYWASKLSDGNFAYTCADSTGHGVPGAIMSILNISSLELAIKEKLTAPSEILNYTRTEIINRLKKDGSEEGGKDGMDCSLIILNKEKTKLTYSAANNPIWIIRENELIELKPDKMPVGKHDKDQNPFTQHEFDLQKGDLIYSLTDGMPDQFGGTKGKKYKYTQLKEFLISISMLSMHEQHQKLKSEFENWKGDLEQVDDVCVIGIKV
ncbi:MAG: two-component regulator propeller domain-containing protein [Bacteroidota bacterium]|jgi:ligand-binding sensor domain-containing protein/serine phosphatase RsbU (regulator of sigma subunit)